jgi:hypothetical protein
MSSKPGSGPRSRWPVWQRGQLPLYLQPYTGRRRVSAINVCFTEPLSVFCSSFPVSNDGVGNECEETQSILADARNLGCSSSDSCCSLVTGDGNQPKPLSWPEQPSSYHLGRTRPTLIASPSTAPTSSPYKILIECLEMIWNFP